jgi:hypothetical protein
MIPGIKTIGMTRFAGTENLCGLLSSLGVQNPVARFPAEESAIFRLTLMFPPKAAVQKSLCRIRGISTPYYRGISYALR